MHRNEPFRARARLFHPRRQRPLGGVAGEQIAFKALAKERSERYANAADFGAELRAFAPIPRVRERSAAASGLDGTL